jgi:ankyrin repeat protein
LKIVEWLTGLIDEERANFVKGAGADVNYRNKENITPLWIACSNGRRDVAQFLLCIGADDTIIGIYNSYE